CRFEGGDTVTAVVVQLLHQLREDEVGPGSGFTLMTWIRPGVGVMEIEHELKAGVFDTHGQGHCVIQIVDVIIRVSQRLGGVAGEKPQPHTSQTMALKNAQSILRLSRILVDNTTRLEKRQVGEISPRGKISRASRAAKRRREKERRQGRRGSGQSF